MHVLHLHYCYPGQGAESVDNIEQHCQCHPSLRNVKVWEGPHLYRPILSKVKLAFCQVRPLPRQVTKEATNDNVPFHPTNIGRLVRSRAFLPWGTGLYGPASRDFGSARASNKHSKSLISFWGRRAPELKLT